MTRKVLIGLSLLSFMAPPARADDWPQWMGPRRDGVWREKGALDRFPDGGPKVRWRAKIGAGYSSPSVAGGRVYIHDRVVAKDAPRPADPFQRISQAGVERVLCLDEATGKTLWVQEYACGYTMSYNAGPRAAPLIDGGHVYTFGAEGDLQCRKTSDGALVWKQSLGGDRTPNWGFSSSPMIDGRRLFVFAPSPAAKDEPGGKVEMVCAFDKRTGKLLWSAVAGKEPGYCSPIVVKAGGKRQLIAWLPNSLNSLDPASGKVYWSEPFESKVGMSIATPRLAGDTLLITAFFNGAMMMKLDAHKPAARRLWKIGGRNERYTKALHSTMASPVIKDGYIYGVGSYGQLRCLEAKTGKRLWENLTVATEGGKPTRWGNAFIVENGGRYFLFSESGDLIIAKFSPKGYEEISRAHVIDPTNKDAGRTVVWTHPAFANRCMFVRNDKEVVCVSLAGKGHRPKNRGRRKP